MANVGRLVIDGSDFLTELGGFWHDCKRNWRDGRFWPERVAEMSDFGLKFEFNSLEKWAILA